MIKYDSAAITPVSGVVTYHTSAICVGTQGLNKVVTGIYTEPTVSIRVVCYRDQELIADIDSESFDGGGFADLECPLKPGEQFKVGLYSASGTTLQDVTVRWKE